MNADTRVMEYFPSVLTTEESNATADRIEAHFERHGFGLFAAELRTTGRFIGFIGFSAPSFEAHFTPCVEIGWRLDFGYWGKGLATEGARAALRYGFEALRLHEIISFTAMMNLRSRRVMERIGMSRDAADDFDHPLLPREHPLRRHVLYRVSAGPV
jgi:RimJ/RimL family protein N-acetyltransferase